MPQRKPDLVTDLPAAVYRAVCCPRCGEPLYRAETGWVCPRGLDHTPLVGDLGVLGRIDPHLPHDATRGKREADGTVLTGRAVQLRRVLGELKRMSRRRTLPRAEDLGAAGGAGR